MSALYELIGLLPRGFVPNFAPRLNKLFLFLLEHQGLEEDEAAMKYLGRTTKLKYFNTLKNDLKKALTRYLIANPSSASNENKALYEDCYRSFAAYKMLLLSGKRTIAIPIAEELLAKLQKAELSYLIHIVANDLLVHYSSNSNLSVGLAGKYEKLVEVQRAIVNAESMVRLYHCRVGLVCNTRDGFTEKDVEEFQEAMEHTIPLLKLENHHLNRLIYNIVVARYIVAYDYKSILKYCDEALTSFPADHPNIRSFRFAFLHKKIPALLVLGQHDEAKEIAREACEMVTVGTGNWHVALINRVILCLQTADYQEAYELFKASNQQKCDSENLKELWRILQGYLYFLIQRGFIQQYEIERFSVGKFLNEMPIYAKDKAGNNINLLIIQILIYLQREEFGKIIDRVESLQQYARTYTRNPENKRANIFMNMIIKMEAAQFHRNRTEIKTQRLFKKLLDTPLTVGRNLAVEIIPYTVLWEDILSMIQNKLRGTTIRKSTIR